MKPVRKVTNKYPFSVTIFRIGSFWWGSKMLNVENTTESFVKRCHLGIIPELWLADCSGREALQKIGAGLWLVQNRKGMWFGVQQPFVGEGHEVLRPLKRLRGDYGGIGGDVSLHGVPLAVVQLWSHNWCVVQIFCVVVVVCVVHRKNGQHQVCCISDSNEAAAYSEENSVWVSLLHFITRFYFFLLCWECASNNWLFGITWRLCCREQNSTARYRRCFVLEFSPVYVIFHVVAVSV